MSRIRSLAIATVLVTLALSLARPARAEVNPFSSINVSVNPTRYDGRCPVEVVFTASVDYLMPHPEGLVFNYRWTRSDQVTTRPLLARPTPNQRSNVFRNIWRLGEAGQSYTVSMTFHADSGNTHMQETSPSVRIHCQ